MKAVDLSVELANAAHILEWVGDESRPVSEHVAAMKNATKQAKWIRELIGRAKQQPDGTWRCLADVAGALCLVEVTVEFDVPEKDVDVVRKAWNL